MKIERAGARVAVGGLSAALATAGLVGATGAAAQAAPVSTSYTCAIPGAGNQTVPVTVDTQLPQTAVAGFPVPAGLLGFSSTLTVPAGAGATALSGSDGGKSADFATSFGKTTATAPVSWGTKTTNGDGSVTYTGQGANSAFQLPAAGTYPVAMPSSFTFTPTSGGSALPTTATCTTSAPGSLGSITLSKQTSTTKAKAPKQVDKRAPVPVKVKVGDQFLAQGGVVPTGKIVIKEHHTTVATGHLNKHAGALLKVRDLKHGMHRLVVVYKGDKYNQPSHSMKLKVMVRK